MKHLWIAIVTWLMMFNAHAESASVFEHRVNKPLGQVYSKVYQSLEQEGFYVVYEVNLGRNLAGFKERWGENYNRNKLDQIRSMVFCNGWYANAVSNTDPTMLAFCPLRMTLTEKDGVTTALFIRPTKVAEGSPALKVLQHVEDDVIKAIKRGMD